MNVVNSDEYISADVLVLGGGMGGCFAAIKAAEEGAKVVAFEKADIRRSGDLGTGISEMQLIHPDYNYSYEELARLNVEAAAGIADEDLACEFARDSLDRLLDLESYGLRIRNDDGSFTFKGGADTALGKHLTIYGPGPTVWHDLKPLLARKAESFSNVNVFNRTAAIGLLTEDGAIGSKVVGAVGLETRTGKFVICKAKAVIITTGACYRQGRQMDTLYAPTRFISVGCPINSGEGQAMAYRAGADIVNMEFPLVCRVYKDFTHAVVGPPGILGRLIDGKGKELLRRRGDGKRMTPAEFLEFYARTQPTAFQSIGPYYMDVSCVEGWPEEKGEMQRMLWAIENESTSAGFLAWMRERGEDWTKAPVEAEWRPISTHNNQAGIYIDVNARSSLEGLYCAGMVIGGGWRHNSTGAFVFGARAGRNAAEYARKAPEPRINDEQVEAEKNHILKALAVNPRDGFSWIELEDKARRIATDYGSPFTNDSKIERGLAHLERIRTKYLPKLYARDPREMMRVSEVNAVFTIVKLFLRAALFRKESRVIDSLSILYKTDYPEQDDENWLKHSVIRNVDGEMKLSTKEVKRLSRK